MVWFSNSSVNSDLQKVREKATFDVEKLTILLYGDKYQVERRRSMYHEVMREKDTLLAKPINLLGRPHSYEEGLRRQHFMLKILNKFPEWNNFEDKLVLSRMVMQYAVSPLLVHESMFSDLVENQITDEQKKMWMEDIKNYNIIGTYAQTELGHGTNVQALETTSTYDPSTEEFVINSPTLTSTKFWPGGLGKSSNHVAVMAQLIVNGNKCGVHPFMVQIRDKDTNVPLKGITVGDIGPKFGWNSIDNGFLRFDNVRIPRINMFMKFFKVSKDGMFKKTGNQSKTVYATLLSTRVLCVPYYGGRMVGMAAIIATRYSCVASCPFSSIKGRTLFDTKNCQRILITSFSICFAMWFAGTKLTRWYYKVCPAIAAGDSTFLPELHAITSGMKALSTNKAVEEIEKCRQLCGSNGYLMASGLPKLYDHVSPGVTIDGENTVLYLQMARYLIKVFNGVHKKGKTTIHHERREWNCHIDANLRPEDLVIAHHYLSFRLLNKANDRMMALIKNGLKAYEAWNKCSVDLVRVAEVHAIHYSADCFLKVVNSIEDFPLKSIMSNLLRFFCIHNIVNNKDVFLEDGYMTIEMMELLEESITILIEEISPNVVALGDAFDHSDHELDSCIGCYDGKVFQRTLESTKLLPLNVDEDVKRLLMGLKKFEFVPAKL